MIDSISSSKGGPALCESCLHTYAETEFSGRGVLVRGNDEGLRISYASHTQALLATGKTMPTTNRDVPATVLRWCKDDHLAEKAPRTTIFATLLTPEWKKPPWR